MEYKTHVGVYALILDKSKQNLLLIKKARGPYIGLLDLPGGSIEADELIEEALAREITEETGCRLISAVQMETQSIRYPYIDLKTGEDRTFKHIGILYRAEVSGEPSPTGDGLDSDGAHWINISGLNPEGVTPFVRAVLLALPLSTQAHRACP